MISISISDIVNQINDFNSSNIEEEGFVIQILDFIEKHKENIGRENPDGHLTASAWILNESKSKVLLIHHKKLNRWLQPGGHIEVEDSSMANAALREALEETNLKSIQFLNKSIYDIDVHLIPARKTEKEHYHLDFRFIFIADEKEIAQHSDEVKDMKWVELSTLIDVENSILRMVQKS